MPYPSFALAILFALQSVTGAPVPTGEALQPTLGARDVYTEFKLPALSDSSEKTLLQDTQKLQVMQRAGLLGLNAHSATDAWTTAEITYQNAKRALVPATPSPAPVLFNGVLASRLNALLAQPDVTAVTVVSPELELDSPIHITRNNVNLNLGNAHLHLSHGGPYMIRVEGAQNVRLSGGSLEGIAWGILISQSQNVLITQMDLHDLLGGIVLTGSHDAVIWGNQFRSLHAAGVLLSGDTHHVTMAENEMSRNLGSSNWHASVVLTDRNAALVPNPANLFTSDQFWVKPQPILDRLTFPHDNVVAYNHIADNQSSGIYSDGSIRNVIIGNRIERNSKEGLCLDNGSTADVVAWNTLRANGKRWGKSDDDLKKEFVFKFARLPDGSSPAKLPGISLDNAAFNEVVFNEVDGNFGGGVKMVRTGIENVVGLNLLLDNNAGQNDKFHFFGIELGAALADAPSVELDFVPSQGNQVFGNTIRGSHYAGIFFAAGSVGNNIFDNSIFGASAWAMESVRVQPNVVLNNLTNLKLRNIGSGLDPNLLTLGLGQNDPSPIVAPIATANSKEPRVKQAKTPPAASKKVASPRSTAAN
ncbi:MAG: NosD domain-containing protein [Janthinobacterium lividum]